MTAYRPVLDGYIRRHLLHNFPTSSASLAGLVLCFIACFILVVIAP